MRQLWTEIQRAQAGRAAWGLARVWRPEGVLASA